MDRLPAQWLVERIFSLVEILMPDERKQWGRAMKAEAAHLRPGAAAVSFAGGCLRAALLESLKAEANRSAAVLCAGLTAGFVFFAHSAVAGSGAWPLLWPLFGGAMAALLRVQSRGRMALRSGAWLGLQTGLVAGLLFAIGGATLISGSESVALDSRLPILAIGALLAAGLSSVGAGAATLLVRLR